MRHLHLFMGLFWLIFGSVVLLMPWFNPQGANFVIRGTGISFGWLAIFLALYNLIRWMMIRHSANQRRMEQAVRQQQFRQSRSAAAGDAEMDPNFTNLNPDAEHKDRE